MKGKIISVEPKPRQGSQTSKKRTPSCPKRTQSDETEPVLETLNANAQVIDKPLDQAQFNDEVEVLHKVRLQKPHKIRLQKYEENITLVEPQRQPLDRWVQRQLSDCIEVSVAGERQSLRARNVGSLAIVWRSDLMKFQIFAVRTVQQISSEYFFTFEYCSEAVIELEQIFDMESVISLRPSETIERIQDIIGQHWRREQVALMLSKG